MGILVITWNFPPRRGGIENLIADLCRELRKNHPLFVITAYADSQEARQKWIFRPRWPGLLSFSLYALARGLLLLWRNPDIQVILGGSAMVTPIVLILARSFRRKAVVNVHGLDLIYPSDLYQALCVRWLRQCDRVVANSHYTASLAEEKRIRRETICIIPPGIECGVSFPFKTEAVKKEMGLEKRKVLLYVGRLAKRKGVKEFIERSFASIVAEVPEVCLVIVGANPTESLIHRDDVAGQVRKQIRDMGLERHVRMLGWLSDEDLARVYQASDLMVLPALSMKDDVEGFGIAILEAAAVGKPCVATRVGGIPDAIEDGKSGVLVEPGDYNLMSRTIVNLLRDDQARQALGEYARKRVRERFGWGSVIEEYEKILNSLATPTGS